MNPHKKFKRKIKVQFFLKLAEIPQIITSVLLIVEKTNNEIFIYFSQQYKKIKPYTTKSFLSKQVL
jgi:hypothetical protein